MFGQFLNHQPLAPIAGRACDAFGFDSGAICTGLALGASEGR